MTLNSLLIDVKGVGPELNKKFEILGVRSVGDLIEYFPRRYDDYSDIRKIQAIKPGVVTIQAQIKQVSSRYVRRGMHITEAVASDETGSVRLIWFNQPYRANALKPGVDYYISGDFQLRRQRLSIMNASVELVSNFPINTARIIPIYRETKGLKSHQIRKVLRSMAETITQLEETLPQWLLDDYKLTSISDAMLEIHFPSTQEAFNRAQYRIGFEEVFRLTLAALLNKYEITQSKAPEIAFNEQLAKSFVASLPFQLTDAQ